MHTTRVFTVSNIIVMLAICMFFLGIAYGESIFLTDGRIIEGDIIKENDKVMEVKLSDGKKITIPRKDIKRTLVQDSYKTKMYIMKTDRTVLPVYIVEEDNESYTCRIELQSREEFHVKKSEVLSVSKVPPQELIEEETKNLSGTKKKKEYTWEQLLTWRAPLLRLGLGADSNYDSQLEYLFPEDEPNILLDFFPWRFRNENGNGLDLIVRFRHFEFGTGQISATDERGPVFEQLFNVTIAPASTFYSDYRHTEIAAGIRYAYSLYVGITIQPYVFVLGQWVRFEYLIGYHDGTNHHDKDYTSTSFGYQFGAGIDFGLWSYVGVFVEYAYGYATLEFPNGKKYNGDGQFVYIGASYRTSYGLIE